MKLKFDRPAVMLDGEPSKDNLGNVVKLSQLIASALTYIPRHPQMHKLYGWIRSLNESECIEVDKSDLALFKKTVEEFDHGMTIWSKGQVFDAIEETEERLKKPSSSSNSNGLAKETVQSEGERLTEG